MRRVGSCLFVALGLSLATLAAPSARGQQIVYDPANHAETLLTAARALEQVRNQLAQLENEARMLAKSHLQLSPELSQSLNEARLLLQSAEGLSFEISRISADIETLYPSTWEGRQLDEVRAQSRVWLEQSRASVGLAMAAEARAAGTLSASRGRIAGALDASAGAEGQTSAVQAGNQLLGVSAAELAEIRALLIAQGRALETERMERIARETRAGEIRRRAFPEGALPAPPPARTAF
jgi:P-type conjugative transfer protein TrbJ